MAKIDIQIFESQIRNDLLECRRLFTVAVTEIPQYSSTKKIRMNYLGFQKEVLKAHKRGQNILVGRILEIEKLLSTTNYFKKSDLTEINALKLKFWKHLLKTVFNSFVWIHLGMDRSNVRKIFKGPTNGDLSQQNVESVLQYINEANKDPNKLAIALDFCSFSPICDIMQINHSESKKVREILFIEAKSGVVNEEMIKTIDCGTYEAYFKFFNTYGEKGIKQIQRYFRQGEFLSKSKKLVGAEPGIYENPMGSNPPIMIVANETKTVYFTEKIIELLKKVEKKEFSVDDIENCLVVGAINRTEKSMYMLGEYNIRLYVYHCFINPSTLAEGSNPKDLSETLSGIELVDWVEGFSSLVLEPIIMRSLTNEYLMDLLLRKKIIKLFFSPERFIELCNNNGLKTRFTSTKEAGRLRSSGFAKGLVEFDGKFIHHKIGNIDVYLGDGSLHEILFNWTRPTSVIEQIKNQKIISQH